MGLGRVQTFVVTVANGNQRQWERENGRERECVSMIHGDKRNTDEQSKRTFSRVEERNALSNRSLHALHMSKKRVLKA